MRREASRFRLIALLLLAASLRLGAAEELTAFDPLAAATAAEKQNIGNPQPSVPPQCYTKTGRASNPCYVCHTAANGRNRIDETDLQQHYRFGPAGLVNHWDNLFKDRRPQLSGPDAMDDAALLAYVRADNYTPLRTAMAQAADFRGWRPDLDYASGFDTQGFARDGSGWRAFRYKPFPGTFWPTNGSTDDVAIRLPQAFRTDEAGHPSAAVYAANLAVVEAAVATPESMSDSQVDRAIEPIEETALQQDLDGDGRIHGVATRLRALPAQYFGSAASVAVQRGLYPAGTEFLHTVHYLDPDAPDTRAVRIKEVRYAYKKRGLDDKALTAQYRDEALEQARGGRSYYGGGPFTGLSNDFGWVYQGYIEDADGRLRLQTREEHIACMGCHSDISVTVDQSFGLPRKVPGAAGWGEQSLTGILDRPTAGTHEPEYRRYLERVGAGDELRENAEMRARFFGRDGRLDRAAYARATRRDIAGLIVPSRERALALNRAYLAIVREQSYVHGRDAVLAPVRNVHAELSHTDTELRAAKNTYDDYRLWLDWDATPGAVRR